MLKTSRAAGQGSILVILLLALVVLPFVFIHPFWVWSVFYLSCLLALVAASSSVLSNRIGLQGALSSVVRGNTGCKDRFLLSKTGGAWLALGKIRRRFVCHRCFWAGLLALGSLIAVLVHWGSFWGRDAGSALLLLLLAAKILELKEDRDCPLLLLLGLFLVYTQSLYFHSLLFGGLILLECLLLLSGLLVLQQKRKSYFLAMSNAGRLALQALPLTLLCFVLFPRLPGSLIGLNYQKDRAITGLGSEMTPGAVSELASSDAVAFRVAFEKKFWPRPEERYFRVLVLRDFDGWTWRQGKVDDLELEKVLGKKRLVRYRIYLEPLSTSFLPVLDWPLTRALEVSAQGLLSAGLHLRPGLVLGASRDIKQKISYTLLSAISCHRIVPGPKEKRRCLRLHPAANPRTYKLVQELIQGVQDPWNRLEMLLNVFEQSKFSYTLTPPQLLGKHPIDSFLFSTRAGFCEHYAQALAWMCRAAGLPARVVVGYQGGEPNPIGHYLIVRQSDAHAWVEVAIPGRGWVRVDPVQAVAPERIALGGRSLEPLMEVHAPLRKMLDKLPWLWQIRLGWDALNYNWYRWVVHYSLKRQSKLFTRLHLGNSPWTSLGKIILLGLIGLFLVVLVVSWFVFGRTRVIKDPVEQVYERFLGHIQKLWAIELYSFGPLQLRGFLLQKIPAAREEVERFVNLLISLKYCPEGTLESDLKEFKRVARRLVRLCKD